MEPAPPPSAGIAELVSALGAVIVIGGAVLAAIVIASASGAAGAAAASALLVKYGLEFHRRAYQLEIDIESMCSEEVIRVKHVYDMSFRECVDYVITATCYPNADRYQEILSQLPDEMSPKPSKSRFRFVHCWSIK